MAELNHTILLTKRSRLIISATVLITAEVEFGVIATQGTQANFILVINGVQIEAVKASAGVGVSNTATICNFMIDKDPGTYTLEFIVANSQGSGSPKTQAVARYSSVMVIPQ